MGKHTIQTTIERTTYENNGKIPVSQEKIIEENIERNLMLGIIRESKSPWCSRMVLASKPDGKLRLRLHYRSLNKITIKDRYTSPRIDEIYDKLSSARIFSILDATSGYYQVSIKEKTAFIVKGWL
ncbi:Retrovirus-related Pol polyprotein from transposon [Nosema granulosis]|uniref:Retrovirus-related Pol polyprotein from transposon n=1 Tax=Nosema granulosis TaxID=83296 RepID=A0A9P6KY51_9MICR|nr:Retrovirus-related Pol polyprotein from transposon [Nosema granulosis]